MEGPIRTVELFAGIGGFRMAAERLSKARDRIRTVWANDNATRAARVYRDVFEGRDPAHPGQDVFIQGDIRLLNNQVPDHDLLTAGFPCQPFSGAGKKEGVGDPRGTLFEEICRVLAARKPTYFILENVKNLLSLHKGGHFAAVLKALEAVGQYRIEWRVLNAKDFGLAQHRQRVFIVGSHERVGKQKIRLAANADLKPFMGKSVEDKPVEGFGDSFPSWGMLVGNGRWVGGKLPFTAAAPPPKLSDVLSPEVAAEYDFTESTLKRIASGRRVGRFVNGVEVLYNKDGGKTAGYAIYGTGGLCPTLTSTSSRHYERYFVNDRYRRLTPVEYARLQGFPEDHCRAVPANEQYGLLGNAVPPPMAAWVIDRVLGEPA